MERKPNKEIWVALGAAVAGLGLLLWWVLGNRGKQPSPPKR